VWVTTAGPLAAASCVAAAGAGTLTAYGTRLARERIRTHVAVRALMVCGCAGLVVSPFLPWAKYAQAGEAGPRLPTMTLTGWGASTGAAWWLLLDAITIAAIAVAARRRSRRATVGALAPAGWIAAAIAITQFDGAGSAAHKQGHVPIFFAGRAVAH
jgi:hypothetical protein